MSHSNSNQPHPNQPHPNQAHPNQPHPNQQDSFDDILRHLQNINQRLNQGNISLEEAMQRYEEGVRLFQKAQYLLNQAEEKLQVLKQS